MMPTALAIAMLLLALRMLWVARQRWARDAARAGQGPVGAATTGREGHRPGSGGRHTIAVLTCLAMAATAVVALLVG